MTCKWSLVILPEQVEDLITNFKSPLRIVRIGQYYDPQLFIFDESHITGMIGYTCMPHQCVLVADVYLPAKSVMRDI